MPGDATTTTAFGAREPSAEADPIAPSTIDVVVTPGLAFDRIGHRVGYGGGFFDRFLRSAAPAAFRAGLAFAVQVQDDELPAGHADTRVHAVVTELEVIRCPEEPVADLDRGSTTRYNAVGPPGAAMDPPDDRRDAV